MDRLTMKLRTLIKGQQIEYLDIYHGHKKKFTVYDVEREDSGIRKLKGSNAFERVYLPENAIIELINLNRCSYKKIYDTSIFEYQVRICNE